MNLRCLLFCAVGSLVAAIPSLAQSDLYDNGPTDGQDFGWLISNGFAASDNFTLSSNSTVNGLTFTSWTFPGITLWSAEVAITSSEFGGTTYFDQIVTFTESGCFFNQNGFKICSESADFGTNLNLQQGTYWLTLQNAQPDALDEPVWWDQNSGPSLASNNSVGTIPSESFTILGSSSGSGTTPEPGSVVLFGSGIFGLGTLLRRKLF